MSPLRYLILLPFVAILAAGQSVQKKSTSNVSQEAETLVQTLYQQVLFRKPVGTMKPADRKIFAPYLSVILHRKLDSAIACEDDFFRQNPPKPELPEKPPFAWLENGTFSGGDDEDELRSAQIERSKSQKDGSVWIYVRLRWGIPPEKPWFSRVIAVVIQGNGHLAVDDLIYRGEQDHPYTERLSDVLSMGCREGHWVGYDDQGNKPKP